VHARWSPSGAHGSRRAFGPVGGEGGHTRYRGMEHRGRGRGRRHGPHRGQERADRVTRRACAALVSRGRVRLCGLSADVATAFVGRRCRGEVLVQAIDPGHCVRLRCNDSAMVIRPAKGHGCGRQSLGRNRQGQKPHQPDRPGSGPRTHFLTVAQCAVRRGLPAGRGRPMAGCASPGLAGKPCVGEAAQRGAMEHHCSRRRNSRRPTQA